MTNNTLEKALEAHLSGDLHTAKLLYKQAIARGSRHPSAFANLGCILKEEGHLQEALIETKKALFLSPNNPIFLANAGGICLELSDNLTAVEYCKRALALDPQNLATCLNLSNAYRESNAAKEACSTAKKAINISPKSSKAHTALAKALQASGKLKQAKDSLQKAINLNPNDTDAILSLSAYTTTEFEINQLLDAAKKVDKNEISATEQSRLNYAISACYHKLKLFKLSQQHLEKAHELKSIKSPSNAKELIQSITDNLGTAPEPARAHNKSSITRIFIVGMPRSGSTLLESALSMNPVIADLGETTAMGKAIKEFNEAKKNIENYAGKLESIYTKKILKPLPSNTQFSIDKQLYKFRYTGLIAANIDGAKIIHSKRHPLDNILSILRSDFPRGNDYSVSPVDCEKVLIEQEKAMQQYKEQWPEQVYTFNYDCFVSHPKETLKLLLAWLNIEWNENYLYPERSKRFINTSSVIQARQSINKTSLGGWINYKDFLKPAHALIVECGLFDEFELGF